MERSDTNPIHPQSHRPQQQQLDYSGNFNYTIDPSSSSSHAGPSSPGHSHNTKKARRKRDSSSDHSQSQSQDHENENENESNLSKGESTRVQLACFYCRSKRIRCNGNKPICQGCLKANVKCEWPTSRAKKRTKKQMEEARLKEGNSGFMRGQGVLGDDTSSLADTTFSTSLTADPSELWNLSSSTNYLWPTDFSQHSFTDNNNNNNNNNSNLSMGMSTDYANLSQQQQLPNPNLNTGTNTNTNSEANLRYGVDPRTMNISNQPAGMIPNLMASSSSNNPLSNTLRGGSGQGGSTTSVPTMSDLGLSLPTDWSPSADLRLASALEDQMAFINGNPEEDKDLELYYYRFSGSTAIHPGVNRISLKLQRRSATSPLAAPQPGEEETPSSFVTPSADLFDHTGMPHPHVWKPLFSLFLKHCSQHFPSTSNQRMVERIETGTMSQFLACCICSLGARFSEDGRNKDPTLAAAPFIAKAQELIIPLLHLPTYDVVTGLLFLAWGNYGQNSESGLWQYSGMSIRMAIDLGIHEVSELYESPAHLIRTRLLFWSLFVTDRIIAFATGRPASIPEDIIEIPLPTDEDFFPDPARNLPNVHPKEEIEPIPFVQLVKLMIICGRISNVLNGRRGRSRTLVSDSEELLPELLADLQVRLVKFYSTLPDSLRWSAENFKHQHQRGHGGTFLSLHLWANSVLALIYHPELLKSPSGIETPLNKSMERNVKLSLASSRQICECMVFADLVDSTSYTSAPYLTQPLFVGGMAFIHEMRSLSISSSDPSSQSNATDILMLSMAKQNFQALLNAIQRMEDYWAGAGYVAQILEKRSGFPKSSKRRANKKTFISLPDTGLLKRFTTNRDHPSDIAPPTETSLRESIARNERSTSLSASGPTPLWLADLMSGYTVQNMSFAPADTLDLERLLASGSGYGLSGFAENGNGIGNGNNLRGDGGEDTPSSGSKI